MVITSNWNIFVRVHVHVVTLLMTIKTFRFENGNDYGYDINLKFFSRILKKIDTPKSFIVHFSFRKDSTIGRFYTKGRIIRPDG